MAIKELRQIRKLDGKYPEKNNLSNVGASIFSNSQVHKLQGGNIAMAMASSKNIMFVTFKF